MMYRRKLLVGLMTLQIVFALVFILAFVNFVDCRSILNIGLPGQWENGLIMGFSLLSMINVAYEVLRV